MAYIKITRPNNPQEIKDAWYKEEVGNDFEVVSETRFHYMVPGERSVPKEHALLLEGGPSPKQTPQELGVEKIVVNTEGIYVGELAEKFADTEAIKPEIEKLVAAGMKKEDVVALLTLFGESLAEAKKEETAPTKEQPKAPNEQTEEKAPVMTPKNTGIAQPLDTQLRDTAPVRESGSVITPAKHATNAPSDNVHTPPVLNPSDLHEYKEEPKQAVDKKEEVKKVDTSHLNQNLVRACENLKIDILITDTNNTLKTKLAKNVTGKEYTHADPPQRTPSPEIANKSNADLCHDLHMKTSQKVMKWTEVEKILLGWGVEPEIIHHNEFSKTVVFDKDNKQLIRVEWP